MFYQNIEPVAFALGPLSIHWYGILFVLALALGFYLVKRLGTSSGWKFSQKDYDDLFFYLTLGVLVGARLGSVLSNLSFYLQQPIETIAVWNGGMAFHGGLVGLIIAGLLFSRKKKISFYELADVIVIPAALGLAIGRVANFINGEFYGNITNLPWGVKFANADGFRHPVQIYESAKNLIIFSVLWLIKGKKLKPGTLFYLFITLYGVLRFSLEFLKDSSTVTHIAGITWGQFWSIPMVLVGAVMLLRRR